MRVYHLKDGSAANLYGANASLGQILKRVEREVALELARRLEMRITAPLIAFKDLSL